MRPLIDAWRSATARLILIYGALFALWCVVLMGVVQWEASNYLNSAIDQLLQQRMSYLVTTRSPRVVAAVDAAARSNLSKTMWSGLFDAQGRPIAGNILHLPRGLPLDGQAHALSEGVALTSSDVLSRARGLAVPLPNGEILMLAKSTSTVDGVGAIIRHGLLWGLSLTLLPGLLGGVLISRGPARRIRAIQLATEPIRRGDLSRRLPVHRRGGDELDLLAGIVNGMLDEIERLMGEVKGVCDNIAHDLRTPLTRLRARLYRAQQQLGDRPEAVLVEDCLADIDSLLARFRALLRISELEDTQRSAGFTDVDLPEMLGEVHAFYMPLAEDRGQTFVLEVGGTGSIRGDRHLLFEALANLVDNAIKFSPQGGHIRLRTHMLAAGPRIDVIDSGPGIAPDDREAVRRRFYRGDSSRSQAGWGLGLSCVSAIIRLHGYTLEIADADGRHSGARISLHCYQGKDLAGVVEPKQALEA